MGSETAQDEVQPKVEENASAAVPVSSAAAANREGTTGGDDIPTIDDKQQQVRPEQVRQDQLMPPHPLAMVEPRPLPRVVQPGGADNSETDSADEMGASQNAAAEAQGSNVHPSISRSNGNIGQVYFNWLYNSTATVT